MTRHRALASALVAGALVAAGAAGAAGAEPTAGELHIAAFTAPGRLTQGSAAEVRGRVAPAGAVAVTVERLGASGWRAVTTVQSAADGRFRARMRLPGSTSLRAVVRTAGGVVASPRRFVGVTRRLTLSVTVQRYANIAGQPFGIRGALVGAEPGERAAVEGSVDGGPWRTLARPPVRAGRVATTVRPPTGGTWRFRLAVAPRPGRDAGGRSPATTMRVFGLNPHDVPASEPHYLVQEISEWQLYYYTSGRLQRVFPVVFGAPSTPSPVGRFAVYSKTPGPGPAFGPYALWYHGNYGIHGTNQEHLLSRSVRYYSHGCTRNLNANIRWLYPRIPVGTPVLNLR